MSVVAVLVGTHRILPVLLVQDANDAGLRSLYHEAFFTKSVRSVSVPFCVKKPICWLSTYETSGTSPPARTARFSLLLIWSKGCATCVTCLPLCAVYSFSASASHWSWVFCGLCALNLVHTVNGFDWLPQAASTPISPTISVALPI